MFWKRTGEGGCKGKPADLGSHGKMAVR